MRYAFRLGKVQREVLRDLIDGDARSLSELCAGHPYISVQTALKSLEAKGLIETWRVPSGKRGSSRKLARLTAQAHNLIWSGVPV